MNSAGYMLYQLRPNSHLLLYQVHNLGIAYSIDETVCLYSLRTRHFQVNIDLKHISYAGFLRAYAVIGIDPQPLMCMHEVIISDDGHGLFFLRLPTFSLVGRPDF